MLFIGVFFLLSCFLRFYTRWKDWESWYSQSFGLHFSLREEQWQEDWAFILSLASQVRTLQDVPPPYERKPHGLSPGVAWGRPLGSGRCCGLRS